VNYGTTKRRMVVAVLCGAVLAAAIQFVHYGLPLVVALGVDAMRWEDVLALLGVASLAFAVWLIGITAIGGPLWFALHRRGWRQPWMAAILGGLLPFIVWLAYDTKGFTGRTSWNFSLFGGGGQMSEDGVLTAGAWQVAIQDALTFGGLLIWRIAYRKTESADP
jgi:hypothetical protein